MLKQNERVYLIDGSSYIYRAYFAIRHLSNSKGEATNAVYGFTHMLLTLLREEKPDRVAVVFDAKGSTFARIFTRSIRQTGRQCRKIWCRRFR